MAKYFLKSSGGNDANDGLDPLGLALSGATYDHTGNGEGERHLSSAGAFSGYSFTAGDRIYLSGAAGGVAAGLYEIASKVDDDAILLAADAGLTADSTGDVDSSDGPWASPQFAFDTATAGDTVVICADGAHSPTATVDVDTNSGASGSPISFVGAAANGAEDGTWATISGASLSSTDTLIAFDGVQGYIAFRRLRFTGGPGIGLDIAYGSNGIDFDEVRFDNFADTGVYLYGGQCNFTDFEYDNNGVPFGGNSAGTNRGSQCSFVNGSIHDNTGDGAYMHGTDILFFGCRIYDNGGMGIKWQRQTYLNKVLNCTIFGNTGDGIGLGSSFSGDPQPFTFLNNVISDNGGYGVNMPSAMLADPLIDYNLFNANTSGHRNNFPEDWSGDSPADDTDPGFVSETDGAEDFTPDTGSALIDAGLPIGTA